MSHFLRTSTDEIDKLVAALGPKCAGVYSGMQPHSPREDVIAAANMARDAGADLLVTCGGGSLTDAGTSRDFPYFSLIYDMS